MNTAINDPLYESGDVSPTNIPDKIVIQGAGSDPISALQSLTQTLPNADANSGGVASYVLIDYMLMTDTITTPGFIYFQAIGIAQNFNAIPSAKRDFL